MSYPMKHTYVHPYRAGFLTLAICIAILNIAHLIVGATLTAEIDYTYLTTDGHPRPFYVMHQTTIARVRLGFFYCSIPLVLSIVGIYSSVRISQSRLPRRAITFSALLAFSLWAVQMSLEGSCSWISNFSYATKAGESHCPYAYVGFDPREIHSGGLVAAWIVPWFVIPLLVMYVVYFWLGLKVTPGGQVRDVVLPEYGSPNISVPVASTRGMSLHSLSSVAVQETTVLSTKGEFTRGPPSYRSSSQHSMDPVDTKKE